MADYYIQPSLKDLLIYGIFEEIGDGIQHLEVGLIEILRKATKEISLVGLCVWKALDASRMCNKGKGILFYSGYGVQMHIDNARKQGLVSYTCIYMAD